MTISELTKQSDALISDSDQMIGRLRYKTAVMYVLLEWQHEDLNPCEHFSNFLKAIDDKYQDLLKK